jgi:hypothetical protein
MTHPLKRLCVRIDKSTTTPALFSYFFPLIELTVVTLFAMSAHVPPPRLVLFIPFRLDVLNSNLTFFFFFFPPVIFWSFSLSLPPTYTQQLTDEQSYRRRHSSLPMQKFLFFHVWPSANASLLIWRISERCTQPAHPAHTRTPQQQQKCNKNLATLLTQNVSHNWRRHWWDQRAYNAMDRQMASRHAC